MYSLLLLCGSKSWPLGRAAETADIRVAHLVHQGRGCLFRRLSTLLLI